jgi:stearoyl-CoA desaturase (delta-9 desaturase)
LLIVFSLHLLSAFALAFALSQVANLVTTLYLHRTLAHRAITMTAPVEFVCRALLWLTVGIDRREWVAVHRKHHVFNDEAADPHSPVQKGVAKVLLLNAGYYRVEAKQPETVAVYGRDLAPDRLERMVFSKGLVGVGLGLALLIGLFGPLWGIGVGLAHAAMYILQGGLVNSFAHHFGKRPHPNSATNLRWVALLTGGEGMHNDHHEFPRSPRFGTTWWDLGGKLASGLQRLKLVKLHESSRLVRQTDMNARHEKIPELV